MSTEPENSNNSILRIFEGHTSAVINVSFSPYGKIIASSSTDNTIILWNKDTGEKIRILTGHTDDVYSVSFSPDGKIIASASQDNTLILWNTETGEEIRTLKGHTSAVRSVSFSPDGKIIASASWDNTIILWNKDTGEKIRTLKGHNGEVYNAIFSPDGKTIASTSYDKTLILWNTETGKKIRTLEGHFGQVWSTSFSPDGKIIASASQDNTLILWNKDTGEKIRTLKGHTNAVRSVSFSPDGKIIASASWDNTIILWNKDTGEKIRTLKGHTSTVYGASFSPDGKTIVSGSTDKTLILWDISHDSPELLEQTPLDELEEIALAEIQSKRNPNLDSATITDTSIAQYNGHTNGIYSVSFSSDGKSIVSASHDTTLILWDVETGEKIRTLKGHTGSVYSACLSPDGKTIASGSADKTLIIWNTETGEKIRTLKGHLASIRNVSYSPNSKTIASTGRDNTVILWDVETGEKIRTLKGHASAVWSASFSPDGGTIVSASLDDTLILWNAETGEGIKTLHGHTNAVRAVSFSSNGKTIASGSDDNTLILWDAETGEKIRTLTGHMSWVLSVSFSPDGKTIASASADTTMILWNVETGERIKTLHGHTDAVRSVSFSPGGKVIASASYDKTLRLWATGNFTSDSPVHTVTFHGIPAQQAAPLQLMAQKIGKGLALGNLSIRMLGSTGTPQFVHHSALLTLIQNARDPNRYLTNVVLDFVATRRFAERVLNEDARTDRLLTGTSALIVLGTVEHRWVVEEALRRNIPVIPVHQPGSRYIRELRIRCINAAPDDTTATLIEGASYLLADGTAEEIGEKLPTILQALSSANKPTISEPIGEELETPTDTALKTDTIVGEAQPLSPKQAEEIYTQSLVQSVQQVAVEYVHIVREHSDDIEESTLDIHLMADPTDPYFTCLTFRDRSKQGKPPVFFEGRLDVPFPHKEQALFEALFNNDRPASLPRLGGSGKLRDAFKEITGHIHAEDSEKLHIHLRINNNVPDLHRVPWERLQEEKGKDPLAIAPDTPFARVLHTSTPSTGPKSFGKGEKVRLLLARSAPADNDKGWSAIPAADLLAIQTALKKYPELPVEMVVAGAGEGEPESLSLQNLYDALKGAVDYGTPFQALYLLCHGEEGGNCLLLGGKLCTEEEIVEKIKPFKDLGVIVLASCWTAQVADGGDAFKSVGRALVDAGIPAVVAMQKPLEYQAAVQFAVRFFMDLLQHGEADVAVNAARYELWHQRDHTPGQESGEIGARQWWVPVLFLRYQNGPLWTWAKGAAPPDLTHEKLKPPPPYPTEAGTGVLEQELARLFANLPFAAPHLASTVRDTVHEHRSQIDDGEPPDCWKPKRTEGEQGDPPLLTTNIWEHIQDKDKEAEGEEKDDPLDYGESAVITQALAALQAGKHLILCGPPGTGKTTLAEALCAYAKVRKYCSGHVTVTATSDWTTFDTVGGYMPDRDRRLRYRPGLIPRAIKEGHWVVLDEINRADIDKAFGELFTLLSGQGITLPYEVNGLPVRIRPEKDNLSGDGWDYVASSRWRIIGTMNIFDKSSLYSMSLAFQRRFAFIHVPLPDDETYQRILRKCDEKLYEAIETSARHLFLAHGDSPLRKHRGMGPAIAKDLVRYLQVWGDEGKDHLHEAISLYIVPQLEGLEEEIINKIWKHLAQCCTEESWGEVSARIRELYPFKESWPSVTCLPTATE